MHHRQDNVVRGWGVTVNTNQLGLPISVPVTPWTQTLASPFPAYTCFSTPSQEKPGLDDSHLVIQCFQGSGVFGRQFSKGPKSKLHSDVVLTVSREESIHTSFGFIAKDW